MTTLMIQCLNIDCVDPAEVARLEVLGARRVDIGQGASASWVVMADPAGHEFCVLRAYRPEELATG